jgi:hypothetical protein
LGGCVGWMVSGLGVWSIVWSCGVVFRIVGWSVFRLGGEWVGCLMATLVCRLFGCLHC